MQVHLIFKTGHGTLRLTFLTLKAYEVKKLNLAYIFRAKFKEGIQKMDFSPK
jgi:hypothetical protein